ncbi:photosystem II stability/assembly factor-like uncharacterized protein [Allocatelliglobosispora scoriae]|uniref:Photosystem II stability/assembly factor-like uncharacterized protein n=1 Tax=Allocatelliglobosispora scoriae TaxID=643052 RepID=A0A841BSZ0_9ACTN|nr:exo-alpha-sialidase [Allocatelliglobosispora scoriae]MBB5869921.1 photosystem II stability/assembly factor-like uncharacterized protein [Allocatelliglobosispora scoriae]
MSVLLMIGTAKGLFLARSDDYATWHVSAPHFPECTVYGIGVHQQPQGLRLLADITSSHFGPSVASSDDLGASWHEPEHAPIRFPADADTALRQVWQFASAGTTVYAGTQPSALFRSADGGESFELVKPLWEHPHRTQWGEGFGGQAIHTILPHPVDPQRVLVAMSTGGVYQTDDGGGSWRPTNTGVQVTFSPDRFPEFGQCVHKVARDCGDPERLYLQNHNGVYRSDDGGVTWTSIAAGLPSDFGFAIVAHPTRPGVIYSFPLQSESRRVPVDRRFRVFRSEDAGASWAALTGGLPADPYYPVVLRDALCHDGGDGLFVGSKAGEVFASGDGGDSWHLVAAHLPTVFNVKAVRL